MSSPVILVTGATGNLGRAVVDALAALDPSAPLILSDVGPSAAEGHERFEYRQADCRSLEQVRELVTPDVDVLAHLPAWHGVHLYSRSPVDYWELNVNGTQNALTAAAERRVKGVVWAGSNVVYGPSSNVYCFSKQVGERLLDHFHGREKLPVIALRFSNFTPYADFIEYGRRLLDGGSLDRRDAGGSVAWSVKTMLEREVGNEAYDVMCESPFSEAEAAGWATDPWAVLAARWPESVDQLREHLGDTLPGGVPVAGRCAPLHQGVGFTPQHHFGTFVAELRDRSASGDLSAPVGYSIA